MPGCGDSDFESLELRFGGPELCFCLVSGDEVLVEVGLAGSGKGAIVSRLESFDRFLQRLQLPQDLFLGFPLGFESSDILFAVGDLPFELFQSFPAFGCSVIGLVGQGGDLDLHSCQLASGFIDFGRHRVDFHSQPAGRLVDQIDRLVGQKTVADVSVRECGGSGQGVVCDADAVVGFVTVLESTENRDCVIDGGFFNQDGLKSALKRRVLLDVLTVFVKRGGSDAVEFASGEHRLEQVGGIERSLGRTGSDDSVQFVDEQDHLAVGGLDLLENRLESVLEFAAVLRPGDQRAQVQCHDTLVGQLRWNISPDDALGESLDDRGLADTRLADQYRVVFSPPREDLDDATDLLVSANDGVESTVVSQFHQVLAVLSQRIVFVFGRLVGDLLVAPDQLERFQHVALFNRTQMQEPSGCVLAGGQGQQQVFGREVTVAHGLGSPTSIGEQPGQSGRGGQVRAGARDLGKAVQFALDEVSELRRVDADPVEQRDDDAVAFFEQCGQEMERGQELVMAVFGGLLCPHHGFTGLDRQSVQWQAHLVLLG